MPSLLSKRKTLKNSPNGPGKLLARATSTAQDLLSTTEVDLVGMSITFDVPADYDVAVKASVPLVYSNIANGSAIVKLTDGSNVQKDSNSERTGTLGRNYVTLPLEELIPAGSGTVTRKLRGVASDSNSLTNLASGGKLVLEAVLR